MLLLLPKCIIKKECQTSDRISRGKLLVIKASSRKLTQLLRKKELLKLLNFEVVVNIVNRDYILTKPVANLQKNKCISLPIIPNPHKAHMHHDMIKVAENLHRDPKKALIS